jgi:putative transposase
MLGVVPSRNDIRTGRHCVFLLHVHLVFVTKYRRHVFQARHLDRLAEIFASVCSDFRTNLVEFNGDSEHVHLLVEYAPTLCVTRLVNSLKGVSSRLLRQEFPELRQHYWRAQRLWSRSYFAGSVGGAPLEVLKRYIEDQQRPCD